MVPEFLNFCSELFSKKIFNFRDFCLFTKHLNLAVCQKISYSFVFNLFSFFCWLCKTHTDGSSTFLVSFFKEKNIQFQILCFWWCWVRHNSNLRLIFSKEQQIEFLLWIYHCILFQECSRHCWITSWKIIHQKFRKNSWHQKLLEEKKIAIIDKLCC